MSDLDLIGDVRARLVTRRRALGLSQRAVAARMGTTQSAVSDLEHGVNPNPSVDTLHRWAQALGVTVTVALGGEDSR